MNHIQISILLFFISLIISYFFLIKILPFLTLDIPNSRSIHNTPIYRGGGVVFILIAFLTIPFTKFYSLFILVPLILISYLDDLFSLSKKVRYLIQFGTVLFLIINNLNLPITSYPLYFLLLIIGTAMINFTNFIDGIDGLLASNILIIFFNISLITQNYNLFPLMGGILGFLYLNKNPAKVFMGDVGSTYLGAVLFIEIIKLSDFKLAFFSISVAFPILLDAFICVLLRLKNRENIFLPHKKHLYQRLVKSGYSHNQVTFIYSFSALLIFLSCRLNNIYLVLMILTLVLISGLFLNKFSAASFE